MNKIERDLSLDVFKGLCISLVVIVHCLGAVGSVPKAFCAWANVFKLAGFFIVSGYLLHSKVLSSSRFNLSVRCKRLLVPYFMFGFLGLVVGIMFIKSGNPLLAMSKYADIYLSKTMLLRGHSTLWFLPCLMLGEIMLCMVIVIGSKIPPRLRVVGTLACLALLVVSAYVLQRESFMRSFFAEYIDVQPDRQLVANIFLPVARALPASVFLAMGYFLFEPYRKFMDNVNQSIRFFIAVALITGGWFVGLFIKGVDWNAYRFGGNIITFIISATMSSFGILEGLRVLSRFVNCAPIAFLGVNSLIIMATHLPLPIVKFSKAVVQQVLPATLGADLRVSAFFVIVLVFILEIPLIFLFRGKWFRLFLG